MTEKLLTGMLNLSASKHYSELTEANSAEAFGKWCSCKIVHPIQAHLHIILAKECCSIYKTESYAIWVNGHNYAFIFLSKKID